MILGEMKDHWRDQEMPLETDVMKKAIELFGPKVRRARRERTQAEEA